VHVYDYTRLLIAEELSKQPIVVADGLAGMDIVDKENGILPRLSMLR
jgi:hypothetical protein